MSKPNNGGLPPQEVSGVPARVGAIEMQNAGDNKQLSLINPNSKGGKRSTKRRLRKNKKYIIRGGTGATGNSPAPITPPIVPNTGVNQETRGGQQLSYNQLAGLSASVNENAKYDNPQSGGRKKNKSKRRMRRIKKTRTRKARKYTKRRKYY